jgi:oxygen-dependent protoporphyrinogen oxidase
VSTSHSVIVVGAGISGLACAYTLKKSGASVLLLEGSALPGGMIRSVEDQGFLFETGPQSFSTTAALNALIQDLNLAGEFCPAPARAPRYILVNGSLRPVPLSPPAFLGSSLLKWSAKFSILREPFQKSFPPKNDESIADFVRRKFSPDLLNLLVGPFVSGIYAGDPEKISLRAAFPTLHEAEMAAGSIIRGMKAVAKKRTGPRVKMTLASFRRGNQALTDALANGLRDVIRTDVRVTQSSRGATGFELLADTPSGSAQFETKQLVLATPTYVAASLLKPFAASAAEALSQIEYAPVAVVSLGYRRADVAHSLDGFGFLVPRSAGLKILGTVWNSSLFPNRAPDDHVQLTSFLGGATDPDTISLSDSSLVDLARRELTPVLGLKAPPFASHVTIYERAIPQYNLGHIERLSAIADALAKIPGLHLTGNYLRGPAIGACIEQAQEVAESIRKSSQPALSSARPDAFGITP